MPLPGRMGKKFQVMVCPYECTDDECANPLCGRGLPAPPPDLAKKQDEEELQKEAILSWERGCAQAQRLGCAEVPPAQHEYRAQHELLLLPQRQLLLGLCADLQHKIFSRLEAHTGALGALASVSRDLLLACWPCLENAKKELIRTHGMLICAYRPCAGLVGCEVTFPHRNQERGKGQLEDEGIITGYNLDTFQLSYCESAALQGAAPSSWW